MTARGPGTWTNDKMWLNIQGGTVDIQNNATGNITGPTKYSRQLHGGK